MLSLILSTTLLFTPTDAISSLDNKALIDELIHQQVVSASDHVLTGVESATKDTFLEQAKLAILSASRIELEKEEVSE